MKGIKMAQTLDQLREKIGTEIGVSEWKQVTQERINAFADVTEDHQFIHVDPVRAKMTPFGGTVAHGFLTLSLLTLLAEDLDLTLEGMVAGVNYGFDKVRMIKAVPAGAEIRGRFILEDITLKSPGQYLAKLDATVEIKGEDKPAMKANWLIMQIVAG